MADNSEGQARYRAKQLGLALRKSREPIGPDNRGGFQIVDPNSGSIVAGERFDLMTADDVIAFLNDYAEGKSKIRVRQFAVFGFHAARCDHSSKI